MCRGEVARASTPEAWQAANLTRVPREPRAGCGCASVKLTAANDSGSPFDVAREDAMPLTLSVAR